LTLKGKIYRARVQRLMLYGSETLAIKVYNVRRLDRSEKATVKRMSGLKLNNKDPARSCWSKYALNMLLMRW